MKSLEKFRTHFTFVLMIFFLSNISYAHTERVHQYLAREAYKLLKLYLGNKDIPVMLNNLGYKETGNFLSWVDRGSDFVDGTICTGAYREDVQDIVYGYGEAWGIPAADQTAQEWLASVTHFWEADQGDDAPTNLDWVPNLQIPNAYQKILRYFNDMWIGINSRVEARTVQGEQVRLYTVAGNEGANMHYNSIIELFKSGKMYVPFAIVLNAQTGQSRSYIGDIFINETLRKKIVFEILGRMCHLIADMSVPAHVHNNSHIPSLGTADKYEHDFMFIQWNDESFSLPSVTYWDANRVWNTFGNILDPYVSYDSPLHLLMYSTNQLADHFASRTVAGDDIFNSIYVGVQQYFPYGITPTSIDQYSVASVPSLTSIRDATFSHAIRAIAGLFYWFANEASILPQPLTSVSVFGDFTLYQGGTGSWYVTLGNGLEPFTYQWEIYYFSNGANLLSGSSSRVIGPNSVISGQWVPVGTNSPTFSKPFNPYDLRSFKLRCTVRDGSNTTKVSNEFAVSVVNTPPPQASVVADNNTNNTMVIEKENAEEQVQSSYSLNQNYPNPFNPSTKISYSLPEANFVTLKIYDMLGREVSTLVNEMKPAGTFEAEFDASKLSSGTYVYKLNAGGYQTVKKMILTK